MKKCARCGTRYCSAECQGAAWAVHRKSCRAGAVEEVGLDRAQRQWLRGCGLTAAEVNELSPGLTPKEVNLLVDMESSSVESLVSGMRLLPNPHLTIAFILKLQALDGSLTRRDMRKVAVATRLLEESYPQIDGHAMDDVVGPMLDALQPPSSS